MEPRPQIFGHRGSRATHPENTIPGFLHALACGANGVELDVAVTLDEVLVVTHDLLLKPDGRDVRKRFASDLTLPSLDEALSIASPEAFCFDIEAKSDSLSPEPELYARLMSESLHRARKAYRIIVRSFDHAILRAFHAFEPHIPLAALIDYASDEWPSIVRAAEASIISPHYLTVTGERVRNAHQAGIGVSVWTVNDALDWDRMALLGVDTIITDDPCAAMRHFTNR